LKKLFQNINFEQLIFDLIVIFFLVFFDFMLSKSGKTIIELLNPNTTLVLIFSIQFFVTYQLGKLYTKFNRKRNPKIVNNIINVTVFLVLLFLFIGLPANFYRFKLLSEGNYMMWAFLGAILPMLCGSFLGFSTEEKSAEDIVIGGGIFIFVSAFIYFIYLMLFFGVDKHQWWLGILVFLGGTIAIGFALFYIGKLIIKLAEKNIPKPVVLSFKALFISLTALSIIIWQSVHIYGQVRFSSDSFGMVDKNYIFFSLFLTGILPFRILWAFTPPRKIFSIISALIILCVDIFAVVNK
jgi:hypothetical protein